jgi:type I restriction enzyme S subunit
VSEIAKHSLGKMLDKAKNKGEPKPYLRNLNVRWFDFDLSDVQEMRFVAEDAAKYTAVKGDVLICEGGYPGRAAIWQEDEPIYFQKALHRVRFHEPERSQWFLYYLLSKDLDGSLKNHFNGAGIQHFTGEALAQFEVPLPPLAEQQRIVGLLDAAFAGLATAQAHAAKNLQNARALFESHLQSVFTQRGPGWVETKIYDLLEKYGGEIKTGPFGTKLKAAEYTETGVPVISVGEIRLGKIVLHDRTPRVNRGVTDRMPEYVLEEGDIVFGRKGGVERSACVTKAQAGWFLGSDGIRLRLPTNCNRRFIGYQLLSPMHKKWILSQAVGTTMPSLNQKIIERIPIAVCSLHQQQTVVEQLDALTEQTQRLATLYTRKLAALEALKKSLLHQAFTGQL